VVFLILIIVRPSVVEGGEIFRFAVLSDCRSQIFTTTCTDANAGVSPVLGLAVTDLLKRHESKRIQLMIVPGDLISGYLKRDKASVSECNRVQLLKWVETVKPIADNGITVRVTVGNHEVGAVQEASEYVRCSPHNWPYITARANFEVFREVMKDKLVKHKSAPQSDMGVTYSFDQAGCHFAVLAAYTMEENNSFSEATLTWLEKDLKAANEKGLLSFVAAHPPAFPGSKHMWDSLPFYDPDYRCSGLNGIDHRSARDRFWNILKKYKVVAYLCGHEHNIQIQEVEGVWHVVSGGLTHRLYPLNGVEQDHGKSNTILYNGEFQNPRASLRWPWDTSKESYWGWCLVSVEGKKVTLDVYGTGKDPCNGKGTDPCEGAQLKLLKSFILRDAEATQ